MKGKVEDYVALIRAITPTDPRKTNDKLRGVLESLGFSGVTSVISSGNIIFQSDSTSPAELEAKIEAAWPQQLGFEAATVVRSRPQLQALLSIHYFEGITHGEGSYLLITLLKHPRQPEFELPFQPAGKPYQILGYAHGALYTVTDNSAVKTAQLMSWLDKQFGNDITSRTPLTIERILKKMEAQ